MKKIIFTLSASVVSICCLAQSQIITTGNNVVTPSNPLAADVVVGSEKSLMLN